MSITCCKILRINDTKNYIDMTIWHLDKGCLQVQISNNLTFSEQGVYKGKS